MTRLLIMTQFLPVAVFIFASRSHGWPMAFQMGALVAIIQLTLLLRKNVPVSRLLAGADLFLIVGGVAFYTRYLALMDLFGLLRESAVFIAILIVMTVATFISKAGAFEMSLATPQVTKRYSLALIAFAAICAAWSYHYKGNISMAGTIPFVALIVVKLILQRRLNPSL